MNELEPIILLVASGILIRFSLTYTGQAWAKSHAQTVTFMLLPIITYIITKTIAGNIALSLGMIGALSIVRFRHPVKSPLELSIYFLLLTIGIALTSNPGKAIILVLFSMSIIYIYAFFIEIFKYIYLYNYLYSKYLYIYIFIFIYINYFYL